MRVLITGGTGFLGRHQARFLREEVPGAEVMAIGRRACDLAGDPAGTAALLADFRPDAIIHLAGAIGGGEAELRRDNEVATARLLEAVGTSCPGAVVVVSSSTSVYGRGGTPAEPVDESLVPDPQGPYARSKGAAEAAALGAAGKGLAVIVARLTNPVGPGMSADLLCGALTEGIVAIERGEREPALQLGDLTASRDFLPVADCARALWRLARSGCPGSAYNVGKGTPTSISEVVDLFLRGSLVEGIEVRSDPRRTSRSAIREQWISIDRLRRLGWEPRLDLGGAVAEMLRQARAAAPAAAGRPDASIS